MKVFLSDTSHTYKHYSELGMKVLSIQRELTDQVLSSPLAEEELKNNQEILLQYNNIGKEKEKMDALYRLII